MASACSTTLAIPELLEQLLLQLSMRHLLTIAPLVCKTWQTAIDSSVAIQQKLFFRSTESRPGGASERPSYNPLLVELFPPWFRLGPHSQYAVEDGGRDTGDLCLDELPFAKRKHAFLRRGATWRRMLVRQPPVASMGSLKCEPVPTSTFTKSGVDFAGDEYESGLRMGAFYDLALDGICDPGIWRVVMWARSYAATGQESTKQRIFIESLQSIFQRADVAIVLISRCSRPQSTPESIQWAKTFRSEDHHDFAIGPDASIDRNR